MPSYVEGDNIAVIVDSNPMMIKPILFVTYDKIVKYNLHIVYEDDTFKDVELVPNDKTRPYKIIYKKDGKLNTAIGIPRICEINEGNKFCDFVNKIMDANDLLFEMDCSEQFQCTKVRFYLKDIRDIVDLVVEGFPEDPEDPTETHPISVYPIYLNNRPCSSIIRCTTDDNLKVTLNSLITKAGKPLTEKEYTDFTIVALDAPVIVDPDVTPENNKIPLIFTEDSLNKEIKIVIKYYVKEILHAVFEEFTIVATKGTGTTNTTTKSIRVSATTQDTQYLGDGLKPALGLDLTPGYKQYKQSKKNKTTQ